MSTILTSSHFAHCCSSEAWQIKMAKWTLSQSTSLVIHLQQDGTLDTKPNDMDQFTKDRLRTHYGLRGDTVKGWRDTLLQYWKENQMHVTVYNCDQCKHRLACLVSPEVVRTFEGR